MVENNITANRWIYGLAYFGVMALLTLLYVMPIELWPSRIPGPDLLICVTFAWVLRRPQYVPTLLVAAVIFVTDVLFLRPLGLWTALVVVAIEFLRVRESGLREQGFAVEWATVSALLLAITIANRLILTVFLVDQTGIGLMILQLLVTILAYPLVVLLSRFAFSVNKMTPRDTDARGRPR